MKEEKTTSKVNRKGKFIGGYVPQDVRDYMLKRAKAENRSVSNLLTVILIKEKNNNGK